MAESDDSQAVRTLHLLLKLTNRLMVPFSTHLAGQYNISLNEFRMLIAIGRLGPCASHQLAEYTGVSAMSVSRAVGTLQRHGRIEVSPDPANRRRKWLKLTAEGERLYAIMQPRSAKVAEYLFSDLSADGISQLEALAEQLITTLEAKSDGGKSLFLERTKADDSEGDA